MAKKRIDSQAVSTEQTIEKKKIVRKQPVPAKKKEEGPVAATSKSEIITPQIVTMPPNKCVWKFKKKSGGAFKLADGRRIKPLQVFEAFPFEIPSAFSDLFELLEGDNVPQERIITAPSKFVLSVREDGLFDVVDIDGKCLNDAPLVKEDAERLLLALTV